MSHLVIRQLLGKISLATHRVSEGKLIFSERSRSSIPPRSRFDYPLPVKNCLVPLNHVGGQYRPIRSNDTARCLSFPLSNLLFIADYLFVIVDNDLTRLIARAFRAPAQPRRAKIYLRGALGPRSEI